MKAVWQGAISFGMVNIPVKLYSVVQPKLFKFRILCGKCKTPLKYQRFCPKCKSMVSWEDVIKGVEIGKKIYPLTKDIMKKLKKMKSDIEIKYFADSNQIDPVYFGANYYVIPAKNGERAYFLFKRVLALTGKVAIGTFTMRDKDHIVMLSSYKNGILLTTLHYPYEIRNIETIEELKVKTKINKRELELANMLVKSLIKEEVDLKGFKDEYGNRLKKIISGRLKIEEKKPKTQELIKALELSVKGKKKG